MITTYSKGLKMWKASYVLATGIELSRLGTTRNSALHSLVKAYNRQTNR